MARAKNRGYQQAFTPTYTIRRWRLGEYIRLSKEDLLVREIIGLIAENVFCTDDSFCWFPDLSRLAVA